MKRKSVLAVLVSLSAAIGAIAQTSVPQPGIITWTRQPLTHQAVQASRPPQAFQASDLWHFAHSTVRLLKFENLVVGRRYRIALWPDTPCRFLSVDGALVLSQPAESSRGPAAQELTAVGEFTADAELRLVRLVSSGGEMPSVAARIQELDAKKAGDGKNAPSRAAWMSGRYGLMVHWLFARYSGKGETVDGPVDRFDLAAFMKDFDETGADWLLFTLGQNTGAYASPNSVIDAKCGPGHCPKRDLVKEIAAAVHARGKRFLAYLPVDALVPSIAKGMGWTDEDLVRRDFQANWAEVIREWAVRLGSDLDGWWFDGAGYGRHRYGFDEGRWSAAARAGNPACALSYSQSLTAWYRDSCGAERLKGVYPETSGDDYLGGEFNILKDARIWTGVFTVRPDSTWMPSAATVPGTRCQVHAVFCLDGFWPCWGVWPEAWKARVPFAKKLVDGPYFSKEAMAALREKGEFPEPFVEYDEFEKFMNAYLGAGGGVTVNVGITPTGRLNTHSLSYLRRFRR